MELYSRTAYGIARGRRYCMPCIRRGAGIEEYRAIGFSVSAEQWENARRNGMLKHMEM
jgi:hypothetical protein